MTRFLKLMILAVAICMLVGASPSFAAMGGAAKHFEMNVYKDTGFATASGGFTQITSGIKYLVLTAGTNTKATIYSDKAGTARTNPVESQYLTPKTGSIFMQIPALQVSILLLSILL